MNIHPYVALMQKLQVRSKSLVTFTLLSEVLVMLTDTHTTLSPIMMQYG